MARWAIAPYPRRKTARPPARSGAVAIGRGLAPHPRVLDNDIQLGILGIPPKLRSGSVGAGDKEGWITRTPRCRLDWHSSSGDPLNGIDDFLYGEPLAIAEILRSCRGAFPSRRNYIMMVSIMLHKIRVLKAPKGNAIRQTRIVLGIWSGAVLE